MTTICWDGKALACDGRTTAGNLIVTDIKDKIHRFTRPISYRDDALLAIGLSGVASDVVSVLAHFYGDEDKPDHSMDAIIVGESFVYRMENGGYSLIEHPLCTQLAIGSGQSFALSAMRLGMGAKEAIEHAKIFDCFSGGRVTIATFEGIHSYS